MVTVVVDTNVIKSGSGRPLQNNEMRRLLSLAKDGALGLLVAEIVLREAANKWAQHVVEMAASFKQSRAVMQEAGLLGTADLQTADKARLRGLEEARIREVVTEFGGEIATLPSATHNALVSRALARRQPFDSNGRNGYRDVILWETLLEAGESDRKMVFISRDKKAFFEGGDSAKGLAATLKADVATHFGDEDAVRLLFEPRVGIEVALELAGTEQEEMLRVQAAENEAVEGRLNGLLQDKAFRERIDEAVETALANLDLGQSLRGYGIPDSDVLSAHIEMVEMIDSHEFASVYLAEDGNALADLVITLSMVAELSVHPSDSILLDEQPQISISDLGWGGGMGRGHAELAARITLECEVDPEERELVSLPLVSEIEPLTPKEFLNRDSEEEKT